MSFLNASHFMVLPRFAIVLGIMVVVHELGQRADLIARQAAALADLGEPVVRDLRLGLRQGEHRLTRGYQIGRASCRERV